jgi:RNA polymerase sigma-70 factor, ECF subfamily
MSPKHEDWALCRRILSGDERAFRAVYDDFFPRLYRFARARLGGRAEEAREFVQLTFCRAFERLDSYRGECSLFGWFCQICRNAIVDAGRSQQRAPQHVGLDDGDATIEAILISLSAPTSEEPEQKLWQSQLIDFIQAALDCLPDHYGDVLEWKYVDGLSVNEIATKLAVGPKAAESQLSRARQAFREAVRTLGGALEMSPNSIEGVS